MRTCEQCNVPMMEENIPVRHQITGRSDDNWRTFREAGIPEWMAHS